MSSNILLQIEDLNLTYLLLAKRVLEEDFPSGLFRLGISQPEGLKLLSLTAKQISQLSRTNQLVFNLRLGVSSLEMNSSLAQRDMSKVPNLNAIRLASDDVSSS